MMGLEGGSGGRGSSLLAGLLTASGSSVAVSQLGHFQ